MNEYPPFDLSHPTLPDDFLIAIGKVSYQWGTLESIVALAISKLSGLEDSDPRSAIMVAHMSWPQRMEVLETIINLLIPEYKYLGRFEEVKSLLAKAQKGRNRIAHAKWVYIDGKVCIARLSARGKLETSTDHASVTDIESVRYDIGNACIELLKLILNK